MVRKLIFADVCIVRADGRMLGYDPVEDRCFDSGQHAQEAYPGRKRYRPGVPFLAAIILIFLLIRLVVAGLLVCYGNAQDSALIRLLPFYAPLGSVF